MTNLNSTNYREVYHGRLKVAKLSTVFSGLTLGPLLKQEEGEIMNIKQELEKAQEEIEKIRFEAEDIRDKLNDVWYELASKIRNEED